eukprot:gene231-846_t
MRSQGEEYGGLPNFQKLTKQSVSLVSGVFLTIFSSHHGNKISRKESVRAKLFAIFVFITLASIIFIIKVSIQTDVFKPPLPHTSRLIFALLRGYSWLDGHKDVCQPRTCANILRDGVRGYWKIRDGLTTENIAYRVDMDMKMRLSLKWPASLYRNDSRCGMKFPINGFRVQGNCDPDSETPCCDQKSGYCSSKPEICSCPECTDYRKLISAELADWVPTDPSCFVKNFTQEMTCELLNSHNISIAFIGDSIIRQLSRSLLLFVTGNRHSGIIPVNTSQSDRAICYEDHQITKRCSVKITAHKLEELEPNSVCKGNVKFKFDLVENYKKYLPQKDMDKIKEYLGRNNSFIVMSIGLHYRLDIEAVVREYLDKVLSLIETEGNGLHLFVLQEQRLLVSADDFTITILHTNDVHSRLDETDKYGSMCSNALKQTHSCYGGIARLATKIKEIRSGRTPTLLLDGGDQQTGTMWYDVWQGNATARLMNQLNYDAMEAVYQEP